MTRSGNTRQHEQQTQVTGRGSSAGQNDITSITVTRLVWHWFTCRSLGTRPPNDGAHSDSPCACTIARATGVAVQCQQNIRKWNWRRQPQWVSFYFLNLLSSAAHSEYKAFYFADAKAFRHRWIECDMRSQRYDTIIIIINDCSIVCSNLVRIFFTSSNHRDSIASISLRRNIADAHIQVFFHSRCVAHKTKTDDGIKKRRTNHSLLCFCLRKRMKRRLQFQLHLYTFLMDNCIKCVHKKRQHVKNEINHWIDVIENVRHHKITCNCKQQSLKLPKLSCGVNETGRLISAYPL